MIDVTEKIETLADRLEAQQIEHLEDAGLACQANIANSRVSIKPGNKYTKLDVGSSGKLMIEMSTGNIYGIKGYGQVHRGHFYGTLDTIDEWYWGEYYPKRR